MTSGQNSFMLKFWRGLAERQKLRKMVVSKSIDRQSKGVQHFSIRKEYTKIFSPFDLENRIFLAYIFLKLGSEVRGIGHRRASWKI